MTTRDQPDDLDLVWKALSDPTRRAMLDRLRLGPCTTTELVEAFPHLSRFGVMKHLDVLREAGLVNTRESGRLRHNSLNPLPIRRIYERWVGPFAELWSGSLLRLKEDVELGPVARAAESKAHHPPRPKPGRAKRRRR